MVLVLAIVEHGPHSLTLPHAARRTLRPATELPTGGHIAAKCVKNSHLLSVYSLFERSNQLLLLQPGVCQNLHRLQKCFLGSLKGHARQLLALDCIKNTHGSPTFQNNAGFRPLSRSAAPCQPRQASTCLNLLSQYGHSQNLHDSPMQTATFSSSEKGPPSLD